MLKDIVIEVVNAAGEMNSLVARVETDHSLPIVEVDLSEYDDTQSILDIYIKS